MQIKTILNRVQKFKSFVYGAARWNEATSPPSLEVELRPRVNGWALCSGCGQRRAGYDRLPLRRFQDPWATVSEVKRWCFPRIPQTVEQENYIRNWLTDGVGG